MKIKITKAVYERIRSFTKDPIGNRGNVLMLLGGNSKGLVTTVIDVSGTGGCSAIPTMPGINLAAAITGLAKMRKRVVGLALLNTARWIARDIEVGMPPVGSILTSSNKPGSFSGSRIFDLGLPVVYVNPRYTDYILQYGEPVEELVLFEPPKKRKSKK